MKRETPKAILVYVVIPVLAMIAIAVSVVLLGEYPFLLPAGISVVGVAAATILFLSLRAPRCWARVFLAIDFLLLAAFLSSQLAERESGMVGVLAVLALLCFLVSAIGSAVRQDKDRLNGKQIPSAR